MVEADRHRACNGGVLGHDWSSQGVQGAINLTAPYSDGS